MLRGAIEGAGQPVEDRTGDAGEQAEQPFEPIQRTLSEAFGTGGVRDSHLSSNRLVQIRLMTRVCAES